MDREGCDAREDDVKRLIVTATLLALSAGLVADADARPRRPPKSVDYFTFPEGYIDEKIQPYVDRYDRVIVSNELVTRVTEGQPICRLTWEGRRVDAVIDREGPLEMIVPLPRGAELDEVKVYLVKSNGRDGHQLDDPKLGMRGDTLLVTVPDVGDAQVIDLQYRFNGEGITVDETFLFQPEIPVLKAEYRFSVSRELWQEAADQGLTWEFSATAEPRTWQPTRADSPDFFSWYWREYSIEPLDEEAQRVPRSITVTGYLPAPVLAGLDPDSLPNLNDLEGILDFTASLVNDFQDGQNERASQGGSGSLRDRYSGGTADIPIATGGKGTGGSR
jgi:hypothetical protein